MGLLDGDGFNIDLEDPKKLGLLMAAAGLFQGQQGRRNVSADLSRGILGGLQGYTQGRTMQQEMAQKQLQQQLMNQQLAMGGLGLKSAQLDFADQQTTRDVFARRRGVMPPGMDAIQSGENVGSMGPPPPPQMPPQGPQGMPPQAPAQPPQMPPQMPAPPQMSPTVIPYGKGVTVTNAPASAAEGKFQTFNKYNSIADDLEQAGALKQAQQYRDLAEKYRPKLKDEQVRLVQGKPAVVRNYEDGTTEISPYSPTAKTNYLNTGGVQTGVDEYTGMPTGNTIKNTMSPGDAASNAIAKARLYFDTGMGGGAAGGGAAGAGGGVAGSPGAAPMLPPAVQAQIAKSQAEGLNTGGVTYKNNLDTTVQTGNDLMTRIAESRKALNQFTPGMGAETRLDVARAAQAVGAPDWVVNKINAGDVSAKQEFQKFAAQQAMETLKSAMNGSGRITQAEFKVFLANNPNVELDPKAISKIYDFAQKTHSRNVAEQASLNSYLKEGGNVSQWPAEWTRRIGGGTPPVSGFRYLGKE